MSQRLKGRYGYPADEPFKVTFHPDRLFEPDTRKNLKDENGNPRRSRVFVCSMSDIFHEKVNPGWIDMIFQTIRTCPEKDFLILTKRPQNIEKKLILIDEKRRQFPENVWVGITAENREMFWERSKIFFNCTYVDQRKRFVSFEPLIEDILPENILPLNNFENIMIDRLFKKFYQWFIVGGETGPGARPMNLDWARKIRDEAKKAGNPFFFKKAGSGQETPDDLNIREFPE